MPELNAKNTPAVRPAVESGDARLRAGVTRPALLCGSCPQTCRPEPPPLVGCRRFMGAAQKNRRGRTPAGWGVCKGYPLAVAVGKGSFAFAGAVARCLPARRAGRGCPSASEGACVKSTPLAVVGRCPPVWRVSVRCREHKKKLAAALLCGSHPQNLPPRTADRRRDAVRSPPAGGTG